jgi:hypothetical protein
MVEEPSGVAGFVFLRQQISKARVAKEDYGPENVA